MVACTNGVLLTTYGAGAEVAGLAKRKFSWGCESSRLDRQAQNLFGSLG